MKCRAPFNRGPANAASRPVGRGVQGGQGISRLANASSVLPSRALHRSHAMPRAIHESAVRPLPQHDDPGSTIQLLYSSRLPACLLCLSVCLPACLPRLSAWDMAFSAYLNANFSEDVQGLGMNMKVRCTMSAVVCGPAILPQLLVKHVAGQNVRMYIRQLANRTHQDSALWLPCQACARNDHHWQHCMTGLLLIHGPAGLIIIMVPLQ
jgi:hypothetical protein